jgi:hypothetical protein
VSALCLCHIEAVSSDDTKDVAKKDSVFLFSGASDGVIMKWDCVVRSMEKDPRLISMSRSKKAGLESLKRKSIKRSGGANTDDHNLEKIPLAGSSQRPQETHNLSAHCSAERRGLLHSQKSLRSAESLSRFGASISHRRSTALHRRSSKNIFTLSSRTNADYEVEAGSPVYSFTASTSPFSLDSAVAHDSSLLVEVRRENF